MTMNTTCNKILIAHAFFLKNDNKQQNDKFKPYPPLATLHAASMLRKNNYEISLFDSVLADSFDEFTQTFNDSCPNMLIIYEDDFNFLTKMCLSHARNAAFKMIDMAKSNNIPVIVHSSDASDNPEIYLKQGVDFVIYGEAEQTLAEIVDHCSLRNEQSIEQLKGLYYLSGGELNKTPVRKTLRRLDQLPQPAWDLIDFDKYRIAWNQKHGFMSVNMVTTRGCPYKCNWCAKPVWGQQYHSHSPDYIAEQLQWLAENVKPDHIWFSDDIFGLKKGWIELFANKVQQLNIKTPFMIQSRADLIDKKTVDALEQAGCDEVWLGVESGSQTVLDNMDKEVLLSQVHSARYLLGKAKIKTGFFIQLGYPGEDINEIQLTRDMILEMKPERIGVSVSYPLPGTKFHENVKKQMDSKTHWLESNDLDAVFQATFSSDFYRQVRAHLHDELKNHLLGNDLMEWNKKWQALMDSADSHRVKASLPERDIQTTKPSNNNFGSNRSEANELTIKVQTL